MRYDSFGSSSFVLAACKKHRARGARARFDGVGGSIGGGDEGGEQAAEKSIAGAGGVFRGERFDGDDLFTPVDG
jgi:hypothetical protein